MQISCTFGLKAQDLNPKPTRTYQWLMAEVLFHWLQEVQVPLQLCDEVHYAFSRWHSVQPTDQIK